MRPTEAQDDVRGTRLICNTISESDDPGPGLVRTDFPANEVSVGNGGKPSMDIESEARLDAGLEALSLSRHAYGPFQYYRAPAFPRRS